jgi:predicted esterase
MLDLAEAIALPSVSFILPAAEGGSWYPESFLAPLEKNEPELSRALNDYADALDVLIHGGVPPERIVLAGFSQGACLTAETVLRNPRRYGGVAILTGGLIGPPGTAWPTRRALAGVPVYLTGSMVDEWVPVTRVAETEDVLVRSGALVRSKIFDARPHLVSEEEIAALRELLRQTIAGPAAGASGGGGQTVH